MNNAINNLKLNKKDILTNLSKKINKSNAQELIERVTLTKQLTKEILKSLIDGNLTGGERNDLIGNINPLRWEFGHLVNFWIENTMKILDCPIDIKFKNEYLFDSFRTDRETRFISVKSNEIETVDTIVKIYDSLINNLIERLIHNKTEDSNLDVITSYLVNLSILHTHMHLESFCFTLQLLKYQKPKFNNLFNTFIKSKKYDENIFIRIKGGTFIQGWNDMKDNFTFDNERPSFEITINDFSVSKYPITQGQYRKFIDCGGYNEKKYWCPEGWRWKQKNNIILPLYWEYVSSIGQLMKSKWGILVNIDNNEPMCHVSWYEANAYCRWANCRLPTESEWEYMATNGGTTKYPWGNNSPSNKLSNLNYYYDGPVDVNEFSEGNNKDGVQQLFGNIWEWCQEPIYPYNGFEIDPVYREMSYPFFGFKRICRGGAWCVPDYLINSKYRNAQTPDCRMQYIGFRVCI